MSPKPEAAERVARQILDSFEGAPAAREQVSAYLWRHLLAWAQVDLKMDLGHEAVEEMALDQLRERLDNLLFKEPKQVMDFGEVLYRHAGELASVYFEALDSENCQLAELKLLLEGPGQMANTGLLGIPRERLPRELPQSTFLEMRNLGIALSDGPSGRRWQDVDGEMAMVHSVPDQPLHVRFTPSSMLLSWWSEPPTYARLRAELKEAGAPAVLLAHVAVGLILERGSDTVSLDDLRHAIGWTRRESDITQAQLRRVWRMLLLISSMPVIGKRNETYRDRRTKQILNLVSNDPLIVVRGRRWPDGASSETDIPHDVTLDGGAWIDQYRGNRAILSDFGDILQLARIPAGKPGGAWAQSIGLALNQRWRERAARSDVTRVGEDSHQTVRFRQSLTRRDLLELFRADPHYRDVLEAEPARARRYWDAAIAILKDQKVIGHYAELGPGPRGRQGWQNAWLDQPLDIRPTEQGRQDVAEISRAATVAAAKAKRSRQRTAGRR